ncbi:single-stranded-DNA-specific exonuclease RecJ [candidate division WOR-3 bacterium]|nr:single-stranded-DNA-specific exonuclease RecJ [candidate division WOR-3 bacterium]
MKWNFKNKEMVKDLSSEEIIDHLLSLRNIEHKDSFLNPSPEHLHDPFLLKGVEKASKRIISAINNNENIMIYGDYDVDGISSIALMFTILKKLGANVDHYIPSRLKQGYGLNKEAIIETHKRGTNLIITVDCGINAEDEIQLAKKKGMDIIITDHHLPEREITADIIINPKLKGNYPYRELAGVGVAFKLCQGLEKISNLTENFLFWNLDLVALGTVADVMPLTGENRIITSLGLKIMNEGKRPGINALLRVAGHSGEIKAHHIGFVIGPRINALGRLTSATEAVELLVSFNKNKTITLAEQLEKHNRERKKIQDKILKEAHRMIRSDEKLRSKSGIILSSPGWHEGVIGIVSSRISEYLYRPSILITEYDGICKGSGRSIPEFNLMEALEQCEELLEDFGGHSQACGIQIKKENIDNFAVLFNKVASIKLKGRSLEPALSIDCPLSLNSIGEELIRRIGDLEPFGMGNPQPTFANFRLEVIGSPTIVGKNHLRFTVREGNKHFSSIAFSQGDKLELLKKSQKIDIAFTPVIDSWTKKPTLKVYDIRKSNSV